MTALSMGSPAESYAFLITALTTAAAVGGVSLGLAASACGWRNTACCYFGTF
jgi:hypothetical protein